MLRGVLSVGLLIVSLAVVACGASGETEMPPVSSGRGDGAATDAQGLPPPEAAPQVVLMEESGFLKLDLADSVKTLTLLREVMIGRITGIALPYNPIPGYGGVAPPTVPPDDPIADPSHPKYGNYPSEEEINREPGRLYTVFSVEVVDPGSTGLKPGETIYLEQGGGVYEGVQYQNEGSPLFEVGKTYLLAISPDTLITKDMGGKPGYAIGAPFAQFIIDGDTIHPIDSMWAGLPAVKELTGKTTEAALDTILTARAQLAAETPTPAP